MSKRAELRMRWSKRDRDYEYHFDKQKSDGHWLHALFYFGAQFVTTREGEPIHRFRSSTETMRRLREDLESRGFDPDTLVISVRRKKPPVCDDCVGLPEPHTVPCPRHGGSR